MDTIQTIQNNGPALSAFIIGVYLVLVIILKPSGNTFKIPFINVRFKLPKSWWQRVIVVVFGVGFMVPYIMTWIAPVTPAVEVADEALAPTAISTESIPTEVVPTEQTPVPIPIAGDDTQEEVLPAVPQIQVLYQDDFLDNHNDWLVQENIRDKSYFLGGEYVHKLSCPESETEPFYFCSTLIRVPAFTGKNYRIEFDAAVERSSPASVAGVGVIVRQTDNANYYFGYRTNGLYSVYLLSHNSYSYFVENQPMSGYMAEPGVVNRYGVVADGANLTALVNGVGISTYQDGNINVPGDAKLVLLVSSGSTATFKLDNLLITEP